MFAILAALLTLLAGAMPAGPQNGLPEPPESFQRRVMHLLRLLGYHEPVKMPGRAGRRHDPTQPNAAALKAEAAWRAAHPDGVGRRPQKPRFRKAWPLVKYLPKSWRNAVVLMLIPAMMGGAGQFFYVATSGNDVSGTGAIGAPWATVLRAMNTVAVSDIIQLRAGTYTQTFFKNGRDSVIIENYPGEDVIVQSSGTGGNTWVLENCRGILVRRNPLGGTFTMRNASPTPVIPSVGVAPGGKNVACLLAQYVGTPQPNPFGVTANSQPFLTVDGLIMTDLRGKAIFGNMIGVIVRNCDLSHASTGVMVDGGGPNNPCNGTLIEDNDLHDMDKLWQDIRVAGEGDDAGAMGVHINRHSSGAIIRRNRMWNNTTYSFQFVRDGAGFEPYRSSNWKVYDNEFWDNEITMEVSTAWATHANLTGCEFYRNFIHGDVNTNNIGPSILLRAGAGTKIYNNTFIMNGGGRGTGSPPGLLPKQVLRVLSGRGSTTGDNITNIDIRNNIFVNTTPQNSPGNVLIQIQNLGGTPATTIAFLDYNLLYSPFGNVTVAEVNGASYTQAQLATFRANTPYGDNDIWNTIPMLNAQGIPQPGSPAADAGVPITGYTGSSPDMGYFDTSPTPPQTIYVTDTFNRSVTAGWGQTDNGLTYSLAGGVAADYNVDGDEGTMSAATNREQRLLSVLALDITGTGRVRVNAVPTGTGGCTVYHNVRRVQSPLTCYRFKILFQVGGTIRVALGRNNQSGTEVAIGVVTTPGAVSTFTANTWYRYRYECWNETQGVASLRIRLWPDGGAEPSTWDMDTTDSTTGPLQTAGHLARFTYVDAGVTNSPIIASFDDTVDSKPEVVIPPETYHGSISATARSFMAVTGRKHDHGTPTINAAVQMAVTGSARYPAPVGRQSPPYLLPEALAGAPEGTFNRTDPEALRDDPNDPDNAYIGLTKGSTGKIAHRFPPPGWTLDTGSDLQIFEITVSNPAAAAFDFRVLLLELITGAWTVKKTGTAQTVPGGTSVLYEFRWTRSDLTDSAGANVAYRFEWL